MVRINYVAYLDPFVYKGGGEMIMRDILEDAGNQNISFTMTTMRPRQNSYDPDADLTIMCDVFNEPTRLASFSLNFIKKIVDTGRYIHFDNSYVDTCDMHYLPCNGERRSTCPNKSIFDLKGLLQQRSLSNKCFNENQLVAKIYQNSLLNVFLSPLHKKVVHGMLGLITEPSFVMRPSIDTEKFYNMGMERDIEYLFAGAIGEAKGIENLKEFFLNKTDRLVMVGKNTTSIELPFVEYTGFVPYERMPEYFNRAKNFVYLPRWPEPQGRVVVEAALCGCNLITNEKVGATSFDFDISIKENLSGAVSEFWYRVKQVL